MELLRLGGKNGTLPELVCTVFHMVFEGIPSFFFSLFLNFLNLIFETNIFVLLGNNGNGNVPFKKLVSQFTPRQMPLKGIPPSITPELLYALAKMGHGDNIVIADANFPSDAVAANCVVKSPIRVAGLTSNILKDILSLIPLDTYMSHVIVMDRVLVDKERGLVVPAYDAIADVVGSDVELYYAPREEFYELAKRCFCVVQTDDRTLYANVMLSKGVM